MSSVFCGVRCSAVLVPAAVCEAPYDGAKKMLLVERADDKAFLTELFTAMYDGLPAPKPGRKKSSGYSEQLA